MYYSFTQIMQKYIGTRTVGQYYTDKRARILWCVSVSTEKCKTCLTWYTCNCIHGFTNKIMKLAIYKFTTAYLYLYVYLCLYIILYTFVIRPIYMGLDTVKVKYTHPDFSVFNIYNIHFTTVRLYLFIIAYRMTQVCT